MAVQLYNKYVLGEFELDADKYLLRQHNEHLHLPELPFQVLLYLVERRERYVSRQELLDRFWAGSDAYEETLTKCISTIRTQLNDPPNAPRYIETRKKVGYRYIGPFQQTAGSEALVEASVVELERMRSVSVSIEEEDNHPQFMRPAIPGQLISGDERPIWQRPLVLASAGLVVIAALILAGLVTHSRWQTQSASSASEPIHSIAVLPLKNLTGDPSNEYFSDGMTESLITSLSKIENLKVISRSYIFQFKNKEITPQELGKQLGVAAVLEGSVRKIGNSVRVAVRLVSVDDGRVLWVTDENDHALGDVFALQDEIARNVGAGLKLRLSGKTEQQLARRYTDNVEAYQLYLQGRFYWNNYTRKEDLVSAIHYFEAAIAKDSNYALAYSGLADAQITLGMDDWQSPKEVSPKARDYATKALALDDMLGEAHYSRGAVAYFYEWDWDLAQKELGRALELNAKSTGTNACYLHSLDSLGKPDEALTIVGRALDQNPLSTPIHAELGCASYYARRYDQAIDFSEETIRMDAGYPAAHYNAARSMGQKQMYEQAVSELNKAMAVWGRNVMVLSELAYDYAASARKSEARKILAEMKARAAAGEFVDPYPVAFVYVGLGENDAAIKSLQEAYQARSTWMPWINVEPKFDPLRSDPRFQDLVRRLQLKL